MRTLRSRLALVLLLCFARVLVPDAWVLALHAHTHTVDAPVAAGPHAARKAIISAEHQHCEAGFFCGAAFQLPTPVVVPARLPGYRVAPARPLVVVTVPAPVAAVGSRGPPTKA